jgi:hypothetical protein
MRPIKERPNNGFLPEAFFTPDYPSSLGFPTRPGGPKLPSP